MDMGFGMFIHWSMDSQVGAVISHSMAGASEEYLQRFIIDLPKTFNPAKILSRRLGSTGKACRNEVCCFHGKTSFGLLHVGYPRQLTSA